MASSSPLTILIFSILLFLQQSNSLFLPVTKHPITHHYLTHIQLGSPTRLPVSLIIDLNSPYLLLDCTSSSSPPNSITTLHSRSLQCTSATPNPSPTPTPTCQLPLKNPLTGTTTTSSGELVQHAISLHNDEISTVESFLLACAPSDLLTGLPSGSSGIFGLGSARPSPMSQISHSFDSPKKFSLCLSPTNGMISLGDHIYDNAIYKSMTYTPLIETQDSSSSYTIPIKSIKIQNKRLSPTIEPSSIKISTLDRYSKMETTLYKHFIRGFTHEAELLNMLRVPPMGGFELCYSVEGSRIVPVVDLVLQSEMVKWRIYGHNSMVKINDEVICLGVLDGGDDELIKGSIVLGTHQFEDNLLEFDFGSCMFGFSSSLIKMQTSCQQLTFSASSVQSS